MNFTEFDLIRQLKLGDEKAFCYLFETHYALLCHIAAEILKDKSLEESVVESVVEDVIFQIWDKRENIEILNSVQAYLVIAVRNHCINYLEQKNAV